MYDRTYYLAYYRAYYRAYYTRRTHRGDDDKTPSDNANNNT